MALSLFVGSLLSFLIEEWFRNNVFFRSPVTQIEQAAALAAKRKICIRCGVDWLAANRAVMFHVRYSND
jgi:hypothetical protein